MPERQGAGLESARRLVLAWQITSDWKYDPSFVTEVEVTFTAEGPNTTRVVLEHRDLTATAWPNPTTARPSIS